MLLAFLGGELRDLVLGEVGGEWVELLLHLTPCGPGKGISEQF